ncbi:unnamed protein product [Mycena citricolor]|uniref:F-box domain-containing protein n=1 Tax=Mycena citricolor TaxID=2018698 RepID=A0AAD2H7X4_9AGAR|nr:unnamed protein product [Mycena citricolor]
MSTRTSRPSRLLSRLKRALKHGYIEHPQAVKPVSCPPALDLPYELTEAIFFHYVEECDPDPSLLATVCRHWRSIALSTPALWTHIHLQPPTHVSDQQWTAFLAHLILRLSRTRDLPLSISVLLEQHSRSGSGRLPRTDPRRLVELFVNLLGHAEQWRTLEIAAPSEAATIFRRCTEFIPDLPRLESLTLDLWSREEEEEVLIHHSWGSEFIAVAPRLVRLRVFAHALWWVPLHDGTPRVTPGRNGHPEDVHVAFAWRQITHFTLEVHEARTTYQDLILHKRLPNLVSLELIDSGAEPPSTPAAADIVAHKNAAKLLTLKLTLPAVECPAAWLARSLSAPSLQTLEISELRTDPGGEGPHEGGGGGGGGDCFTLRRLAETLNASLLHTLCFFRVNLAVVLNVALGAPSVQVLRVRDMDTRTGDESDLILELGSPRQHVLPDLRELTFGDPTSFVQLDVLDSLFAARGGPGGQAAYRALEAFRYIYPVDSESNPDVVSYIEHIRRHTERWEDGRNMVFVGLESNAVF